MREHKRLRDEVKVLWTEFAAHSRVVLVETVLAADLGALREVVDHLKLAHLLIRLRLDVAAGPHDGPVLVTVLRLAEAVILKSVANQVDIDVVVKFEIQLAVLRLVRSNIHRVDVRSEQHMPFLEATGVSRRLLHSLLVGLINFTFGGRVWNSYRFTTFRLLFNIALRLRSQHSMTLSLLAVGLAQLRDFGRRLRLSLRVFEEYGVDLASLLRATGADPLELRHFVLIQAHQ